MPRVRLQSLKIKKNVLITTLESWLRIYRFVDKSDIWSWSASHVPFVAKFGQKVLEQIVNTFILQPIRARSD